MYRMGFTTYLPGLRAVCSTALCTYDTYVWYQYNAPMVGCRSRCTRVHTKGLQLNLDLLRSALSGNIVNNWMLIFKPKRPLYTSRTCQMQKRSTGSAMVDGGTRYHRRCVLVSSCTWDESGSWASGGCCGGLIIILHLGSGRRLPNGIRSGWDQSEYHFVGGSRVAG